MKAKQLEPIIKEFIGKKCILRLTSGEFITGTMGSINQNDLVKIYEVVLKCENNTDKHVPLIKIDALREA
jgi:hypothetical protein